MMDQSDSSKPETGASPDDGLKPDVAAMRDFFNALAAVGWLNLVAIYPKRHARHKPPAPVGISIAVTGEPSQWNAAINFAVTQQQLGQNIYFTINELACALHGKPGKADMRAGRFIYRDVDPKPANGDESTYGARRARLINEALPQTLEVEQPTFVIDSGHGLQIMRRLAEPVTDRDEFERVNKAYTLKYGGDATHNIDRLFRVPGSVNFPDYKKIQDYGYPAEPVMARLLFSNPAQSVPFDNIRQETEPQRSDQQSADDSGGNQKGYGKAGRKTPSLNAMRNMTGESCACHGGDRSAHQFSVLLGLCLRGLSDADIRHDTDTMPWGERTRDGDGNFDHDLTKARKEAEGLREDDEPSSVRRGNRSVIKMRGGDLDRAADEAEAALVSAEADIYQRGGKLVRPIVDSVGGAHGRETTTPRFVTVDPHGLRDILCPVAEFKRFEKREGVWVVINPVPDVVSTILSREGKWRFRPTRGVIATPTLRMNGTLLSQPGYDAVTGLILLNPPPMPIIPQQPNKGDAEAALATLRALISEFPFVGHASEAAALSALITPVARGCMTVAPLHAARASTAGSGKSFLMDVSAAIALGQPCPVLAAGKNEEETEKRLGAAMLAGQPIISIDNINGELKSDALCQYVERPIVEIRILGRSENVRIENGVTIFATGNNLRLAGDMTRRAVLVTLDANIERPEQRRFKANPVSTVLANRGAHVAAVLTIVRAYIVAGHPGRLPPLASFEQWSDNVRSALVWLGCADPCETMDVARSEDPYLQAFAAIVAAMKDAQLIGPQNALTTAELIRLASKENEPLDFNLPNQALQNSIMDVAGRRGSPDSRALGRWLSGNKGRISGGFKLHGLGDSSGHPMKWYVSPV